MIPRLAIVLALLWTASASAQPGAAESHVESGDWAAAALVFAAEAENSSDPALWYRLGVVQAIAGDPAGAQASFSRVQELDAQFPDIEMRIAAAAARAEWESAQAADPAGFSEDAEVREAVRARALENGDVVASARAATPEDSPALDAAEHGLLGQAADASIDAIQALGDAPSERELTLIAADLHRRSGDLATARYFLRLYSELGGDPAEAVPVRRAIENAELPGAQ